MDLIRQVIIAVVLGTMLLGIAAVNAQVSSGWTQFQPDQESYSQIPYEQFTNPSADQESYRQISYQQSTNSLSDYPTSSNSKIFIIWVGDKNSLNLPQAEVYLDGNYMDTTDSKGEVRTPITFGTHTISARAACGSASKEYTFSEAIDGASLYIITCPSGNGPSEGLVNGGVYTLKCLGDIEGNRWLDGRTQSATVGLAPTTEGFYTGTKWQAIEVEPGIYHFKCLGDIEGNRWLDGRTQSATVGLAPTTEGFYTGTKWQAIEMEPGIYHFKCLGDIEGNRWLDGRTQSATVGLAPTTEGFYTGTKWQAIAAQ